MVGILYERAQKDLNGRQARKLHNLPSVLKKTRKGAHILKIPVVRNLLEANDRIAEENRRLFENEKLAVINLISSPGSVSYTHLTLPTKRIV